MGTNVINNWTAYIALLRERFEDILEDLIAELKLLEETEEITEYHEKFEVIKIWLNLPEDYLVSAYLAGLRNDMEMHIRMFSP